MADGRMFSTPDSARWFYVPKDVEVPEGGLEVRDLLGRRRGLDPAVLAPYEVSGEAARTLTRREVLDLLSRADAGLRSLKTMVPADQPDGAKGLDAMTTLLQRITSGLRAKDDPDPPKYRAEDLARRFEGWLREVAADPAKAENLHQFTAELEAAAKQLREGSPRK